MAAQSDSHLWLALKQFPPDTHTHVRSGRGYHRHLVWDVFPRLLDVPVIT